MNSEIALTPWGGGDPRDRRALVPSAKTQSSAETHFRVEPKRSVWGPAAFVATMPPTVQKFPLDGSTGKRRPLAVAAALTAPQIAPGPTSSRRRATSTDPIWFMRVISTITPLPIAAPGILLPDPRSVRGTDAVAAQRSSVTTSSTSTGTATACGMMRPMPAASEYTARATASILKSPRNPAGAVIGLSTPDVKVRARLAAGDLTSNRKSRVPISSRTFLPSPSASEAAEERSACRDTRRT